jgi:predicted dehydrogenase
VTGVIGLVGFGRWGRLIFRDLRQLGAQVRVVVPGEQARHAALADGALSAHARLSDIERVDGYVVAVPSSLHADVLMDLVPSGKPVFVEKPLATDLDASRRLVEVMGDRLFVMDKWRYHPGVIKLGEMVRSGDLGRILSVRSFRLGWDNPHRDVDAVWILMPHDLSIALHLLGHLPAPRLATTLGAHGMGNDLFAVLQDGPADALVAMEISSNHPVSRRAVTVIGSEASAQLGDSYDDHIVLARGVPGKAAGKPELIPIGKDMPLLAELKAFLAYLTGGPPPLSPARDGLLVVERVVALRRLAGLS